METGPDPAPQPGPKPTHSGGFDPRVTLVVSLALLSTLILNWIESTDPVQKLSAPERVASLPVERPIELLDGLDSLALEQSTGTPSPLPGEWRGMLLQEGGKALQAALEDVEAVRRADSQKADADAEAEPGTDWSAESLRLRLKTAAFLHLAGDPAWQAVLAEPHEDPTGQALLDGARELFRGQADGTQQPAAVQEPPVPVGAPESPTESSPPIAGSEQPPQTLQASGGLASAQRFDALGEGLSASHLRRLAAEQAGLEDLSQDIQSRYQQRTEELAANLGGRIALGVLAAGVGCLFLLAMPFLRRRGLQLSNGPGPGLTFGLSDGWATWVRYALAYQLILGLGSALDPDHRTSLLVPLASLPLILWVQRVVVAKSGRGTLELLGLELDPQRFGRLLGFSLATWVVTLVGLWVLTFFVIGSFQGGSWANPLLDHLVRADGSAWRGLSIEAGLWAPIFEELGFRAVLFAGLRSRFKFLPAALGTSLLFGLSHGYGLPGNLLIVWVGFVLCWCYERSRSILPGMLVHSLFNLGQLSMMELYR